MIELDEFIRVENLRKVYRDSIVALDDINLKIYSGELVGIVGPNGAGKTTLIRVLSGELEPTGGRAYVGGYNVVKEFQKVKTVIGIAPQEVGLIPYLTVREHIYFFARLKGLDKNRAMQNTDEIIGKLDLFEHKNKLVSQLSGGLRRRVCIAIALVNKPKCAFLDEPTTGLDPSARYRFWNIIRELKKEHLESVYVITSHYMEDLEALSKRLIFLYKGKVLVDGTLDQVKLDVLKYEVKISIPIEFEEKVVGLLNKRGVNCRVSKGVGRLEILAMRGDLQSIILDLIGLGVRDINVTTPSLNDVFIEVTRSEHRY